MRGQEGHQPGAGIDEGWTMRARIGAAIATAVATVIVTCVPVSARTVAVQGVGLRAHGARKSVGALVAGMAREAKTQYAQLSGGGECAPLVVTADTTLKRDAPCGVDVQAENVTLDLGGHTVRGFLLGGCPMTLRNGIVSGAIFSCGGSTYEHLTVRDTDSADTPGLLAGYQDVVRDNRFAYNDVAIDTFYAGATTISRNLFQRNRLAVWANDSGETIVDNTFARNTTGVSIFDEEDCEGCGGGHTITGNLFRRNNIGVSIGALFGGQDNVVNDNRFDHNFTAGLRMQIDCRTAEDGTAACGGAGSVVDGNVFTWNGWASKVKMLDDGLAGLSYLNGELGGRGLRGVTVGHNVATHNFDLGLQVPRAHNGGGNRAAYNGDARQCVGVPCKRP